MAKTFTSSNKEAADTNGRIFGLDVMRACSILFVFLAHSMPLNPLNDVFPYFGWMGFGVEAFFVLSGFLIGRIILRSLFKPAISFQSVKIFWVNRWLRTLPAYLVAFGAYYLLSPATHNRLFYLFFAQNIITPMPGFFSHSWSLAVEEWFYLLFPICLITIATVTGRFTDRYRIYITGVICFIIFGFISKSIYHWAYHENVFAWLLDRELIFPSWQTFLSPTGDWDSMRKMVPFRIDAIAYGCLVAYLMEQYRFSKKVRLALVLAGMVGLVVCFQIISHTTAGGKTNVLSDIFLLPLLCISFALLLPGAVACPRPGRFVAKVITNISLTSYSFYLMHLLILDLVVAWYENSAGAATLSKGLVFTGTYLLIYLISYLMYKFVELPFMNLRKRLFANPARVTSV